MDFDIIRNYVHRMFLKKANFVDFVESVYTIDLPNYKTHTYIQLLEVITTNIGEEKLFQLLGINNEKESLEKIELIPIFVIIDRYNLCEIAEELGITITHQMNRGGLTRAILFNAKLDTIHGTFIKKAHENFILVVNNEGIVLGPNWISNLPMESDVEAAKTIITLAEQLDNSILFNICFECGVSGVSGADVTQKILSKIKPQRFFQIITNMIIEKKINIEKILETITWGVDIDPRYGIRYIEYSPVEYLCDLLCDVFTEEDFSPYLKHDKWNYRDRVLSYCIENDPFDIINDHFGITVIRKCLRNNFLVNVLPSDKNELINLLLFHLGYPIPEILTGLKSYRENLIKWSRELNKDVDENIMRGIATSIFIETEKIIKDIIFFYCAYMIPNREQQIGLVFNDWGNKQIELYLKNIHPNFKGTKKSVLKASLGELIGILNFLNKKSSTSDEITKYFQRGNILLNDKIIRLLNEINENRKYFVHDINIKYKGISKNTVKEIIKKLIILSNEIREIYPIPIKPLKLETSAFRTTYLIAKDDEDNLYTIYLDEYLGTDIFKWIYLMKRIDSHVIINPILVRRP